MQTIVRLSVFATACLMAQTAQSRPISYPGGVMPMIKNDGDVNAFQLDYSPAANYAIGYTGEYWRDKEYTIQSLQFNYLVKRWNNPNSQGNFYIESGAGIAYSDAGDFDHDIEPVFFTGVTADWEDRRYLVSYQNRYTEAGKIDDFFMQSARIGIAPYEGEYGDLHTWLMLQVDHKPESDDNITVTPLVRLFKGTHLIEGGISNKGSLLFNWTMTY